MHELQRLKGLVTDLHILHLRRDEGGSQKLIVDLHEEWMHRIIPGCDYLAIDSLFIQGLHNQSVNLASELLDLLLVPPSQIVELEHTGFVKLFRR